MGHTWIILVPSPCTLSKKSRWRKYEGDLIHTIGLFGCMHLTLYYTLDELKEFEQAGCTLLYDGYFRSEWASLYEEMEQFKERTSYLLHHTTRYHHG